MTPLLLIVAYVALYIAVLVNSVIRYARKGIMDTDKLLILLCWPITMPVFLVFMVIMRDDEGIDRFFRWLNKTFKRKDKK